MKNKIVISVLCLALMSLACLDTSVSVVETAQPSEVATRYIKTPLEETATVITAPTLTPSAQLCAVVVALKVQNLRAFPGTNGAVIGHLRNGEVVQVLDKFSAEWWSVKRGDDIGFARVSYLKIAECEVSHE